MNRTLLSILLAAGAVLCADDDSSLKVKIPWKERPGENRVRIDNSNLNLKPRLSEKKPEYPQGEAVASLKHLEYDILWTPALDTRRAGTPRAKDAVNAPDRSYSVYVEETGDAENGPWGARLLVLENHTGKLIHYVEVPYRIGRVLLLDNGILLGFYPSEPRLKQTAGYLLCDLKTGAVTKTVPLPEPVAQAAAAGRTIFYTVCKGSTVFSFSLDGEAGTDIETEHPVSLLAVSDDGTLLAAVCEKETILFGTKDLSVKKKIAHPWEMTPVHAVFNEKNDLVLTGTSPDGGSPLLVIRNGGAVELADDAAGPVMSSGGTVYYVRNVRNRLLGIELNTLKKGPFCEPKYMKNKISGDIRTIFRTSDPKKLLVRDTFGGVYFLRLRGKRWQLQKLY